MVHFQRQGLRQTRHSEHTRWLHPLHTAPLFTNSPSDFWQRAQDLSWYSCRALFAPFHRSCCSCSFIFLIPQAKRKKKDRGQNPHIKHKLIIIPWLCNIISSGRYALKGDLCWALFENVHTQHFCSVTVCMWPELCIVTEKQFSTNGPLFISDPLSAPKSLYVSDYAFIYKNGD